MAIINFCPPLIYSGIRPHVPLGVLSLAAVARNCGHQVNIRDINSICTDPAQLQEIENYAAYLLSGRPDIVGFSTLCNSYPAAIRMAMACKRLRPDVYVLMGGPQASATAQETLRAYGEIDGIMVGECETAFKAFLNEFEHGGKWGNVPNLVWRDGLTLTGNPQAPLVENLDLLPLPAYELTTFSMADTEGSIHIEAGRGCPNRCIYCLSSRFWRRTRMKSAHKLLQQTRALLLKYKLDTVWFVSDNFASSRAFCLEFCRAVKSDGVKFKWGANVCVDVLDAGLIGKMAEAGCVKLAIGVETGAAKIHKAIARKGTFDRTFVLECVAEANKAGIEVTGNFMIGFPGENLSNIRETFKLLLDVIFAGNARNKARMCRLIPLSGTPIAQNNIHRLEFDGIPPNRLHSQHRLSKKDKTMIRSHPEVFTSFYTIKNDKIPNSLLRRLYLIIPYIIAFPDTTRLLWRRERMRFLDLLLSRAEYLENYNARPPVALLTSIYRFWKKFILPRLGNSSVNQALLLREYMIGRAAARLAFKEPSHPPKKPM